MANETLMDNLGSKWFLRNLEGKERMVLHTQMGRLALSNKQ